MTVPSDLASEARAQASAWIGRSPDLIVMLDWHVHACGACERGGSKCTEYREIIDEYGAGTRGAAVFFPADEPAAGISGG